MSKKLFNFHNLQSSLSIFHIFYGVLKRLITLGFFTFILLLFMGAGIALGYFANIISKTEIPSVSTMKTSLGQLSQMSTLRYDNGEIISPIQSDLIRQIISFDEIPKHVKNGLIATEDSHFYKHEGMVPKAIIRATLQEFIGSSSSSGGSTLTQQLVKQQLLTNEYTFTRKAKELLLAMRLEQYFSKEEILTAYLNVSPFGRNSDGQNIAGIQAAAQGIFGVNAKDLTLPQSAFLVGLPQSPYAYNPYTNKGAIKEDVSLGIKRMKIVLNAMLKEGYITQEEYTEAINYDITKDFIQSTPIQEQTQSYLYQVIHNEAIKILMKEQIKKDGKKWKDVDNSVELYNQYYFSAKNKLSNAGYHVYSTINQSVYNAMQSVPKNILPTLGQTHQTSYIDNETKETKIGIEPLQMGSVAIENHTGKIIGFVGGADFSISQTNHAFSTRRSPGSTIKPLLVYAPAIENNLIYPASMLADTEINFLQPDGTYWKPSNANGKFSNTFVSAREALKQSLNNPAINLYNYMLKKGVDTYSYITKMGITALPESEFSNLAASVGGFSEGPTVAEQTSAFTTFANNGDYIPSYIIEKIVDNDNNIIYEHQHSKTQVFTKDTAFLMQSILSEVLNSTARQIEPNVQFKLPQLIVKTGTSDDYQDLWVLASTPNITIGNWTGWDNNYGVKHLFQANHSGTSQRLWSALANAIYSAKPEYFDSNSRFSSQPSTISRHSVLAQTGTLGGDITLSNGTKLTVNGATISDYFSVTRPPFPLTFEFSQGANEKDLVNFWNNLIQTTAIPTQDESSTNETRNETETTNTTTTIP